MAHEAPEMGLVAIGVVHSPYQTADQAPHQGFVDDTESTIEIYETYTPELNGLEDVHRLTVVYWAHRADRTGVEQSIHGPSGDDGADRADGDREGAFASRGPTRPNPLSICTCMVHGLEGRRIRVTGLDAIDGSPVVDLKPALRPER